MKLLEAVADAGYSLLIVGPHDPRWEPRRFTALTARPSVRYVGSVPEEEVSAHIAAIDVGITPYLDNPFNKASFPLKTLDYLSAGRPAISTTLPASRWLLSDLARSEEAAFSEQIMLLAGDADSFIDSLRRLAGEPGQDGQAANDLPGAEPERAHRCRAFAARHTWARRADALAAAIGLAESN
jgi:teichuronic acid biosynthesis glycosyltransferase TuaH